MRLSVRSLRIPLRAGFDQASHRRVESESILVEAELEGHVGLGEGCPRSYVTGESLDTAVARAEAFAREVSGVRSLGELEAFVRMNESAIDAAPAAWCAVELAVLDVLARRAGLSLERFLGLPETGRRARYTGILPSMSTEATAGLLGRWRKLGCSDFKMKVGAGADDAARIAAFSAAFGAGPAPSLRLDANNAYGSAPEAIEALRALGDGFEAVEEPLSPRRFDELETIAEALGVAIVLDESCARFADLEALKGRATPFVLNLKVSKLGGLLRSLRLALAARAEGHGVIVGAHVGETSVLTRAGLVVAGALGGHLRAIEGGVGTLLLDRDPVQPELRFGPDATLDLDTTVDLSPTGSGLSLQA